MDRTFIQYVLVALLLLPSIAAAQTARDSSRASTFSDTLLAHHHTTKADFDQPVPMLRPATPGVNWTRVGIAGGGLAATITALHIYQLNAWWNADRAPFHVIEDPSYQANFDKAGHIFGAYYSSYFFSEAYRWAGMDSAQSAIMGAFSGALWELYVEIEDGFARSWGFSRGDAKSDMLGASFFLLNERVPFLKDFRVKWFYSPTTKLTENHPDIPGQSVTFIEDYGGQTYYLRADVHHMLPESLKPYWPSWLNLAGAISGYHINAPDFNERQKAWYISLDYDMDKLIPESSIGILNFVRRALGYWHFPAPAFRISPDPHFFLTFPISISFDHGLHIGAEPSLGG